MKGLGSCRCASKDEPAYLSIVFVIHVLPVHVLCIGFVRQISDVAYLSLFKLSHNFGISLERSSLFLTKVVSPPHPSAGSFKQKKKSCRGRKSGNN